MCQHYKQQIRAAATLFKLINATLRYQHTLNAVCPQKSMQFAYNTTTTTTSTTTNTNTNKINIHSNNNNNKANTIPATVVCKFSCSCNGKQKENCVYKTPTATTTTTTTCTKQTYTHTSIDSCATSKFPATIYSNAQTTIAAVRVRQATTRGATTKLQHF